MAEIQEHEDLHAKRAYDDFAPAYDDFAHDYMYERWTRRLLGKAKDAGLRGTRLLDIGCGTGLSFITLLDRGWKVTGCDISPAMIERAKERAGEAAALSVADMRELPNLGEFDLIWSVNDAINYLLSSEELEAALRGMRANLADGGVVVFDVNTLFLYRTNFSSDRVVEHAGKRMTWRGHASEDVASGCLCEATIDGIGVEAHVHRQRHFSEATVLTAIEKAGLRCVEVAGELDGHLETGVDEDRHTKAVYVSRMA